MGRASRLDLTVCPSVCARIAGVGCHSLPSFFLLAAAFSSSSFRCRAVIGRLATQREELERQEREAAFKAEQARQKQLESERQRALIEAELRSARPSEADARARALAAEIEMHKRNEAEAQESLARIAQQRQQAAQESRAADYSLTQRVKSWWGASSTSEKPTIVAESNASGHAVAQNVPCGT